MDIEINQLQGASKCQMQLKPLAANESPKSISSRAVEKPSKLNTVRCGAPASFASNSKCLASWLHSLWCVASQTRKKGAWSFSTTQGFISTSCRPDDSWCRNGIDDLVHQKDKHGTASVYDYCR